MQPKNNSQSFLLTNHVQSNIYIKVAGRAFSDKNDEQGVFRNLQVSLRLKNQIIDRYQSC